MIVIYVFFVLFKLKLWVGLDILLVVNGYLLVYVFFAGDVFRKIVNGGKEMRRDYYRIGG